MTDPSPDILCPFCGSGEAVLQMLDSYQCVVRCVGCGAEGPPTDDDKPDEAWSAWKRRSRSPPHDRPPNDPTGEVMVFDVDRKLIDQMLVVAESFAREGKASTAALLRKAAWRMEKLAARQKKPKPQEGNEK